MKQLKRFVVTATVAFAALICANSVAVAQSAVPPINEDFELNIAFERITETDFIRSTEAELTTPKLRLRVGVSVDAGSIDVTLRGITGRVRFRASMEELLQRVARLRSELNSR